MVKYIILFPFFLAVSCLGYPKNLHFRVDLIVSVYFSSPSTILSLHYKCEQTSQ
jgi:hypothetical protein